MYEVLHVRRVGENGDMTHLKNVLAHNARENIDPESPPEWRNPDWEREGDDLHRRGVPSDMALNRRTALLDGLKRKPMKNASLAVEFNVSAGEGFTDWKNYFKAAEDFLWKRYGRENCISSAIHTDESTPHMHVVFVPIIGTGTERRYSSSAFMGKRDDLIRLHDDFWKEVGCKFGLERGEEGSRARHGDAREFNRKLRKLEADRKALVAERVAFEQEKKKEMDAILQDKKPLTITVNGIPRKLANGLLRGFVRAVELVDKLTAENARLRQLLQEKEKKRSGGNDYTR